MLLIKFCPEVVKNLNNCRARISVSYSLRIPASFFIIVPFKTPYLLGMNRSLLIKLDLFIYGSDEGSSREIN